MANDNRVLIAGNTYPVKDQLRAMGGQWDAAAKGWRVPADRADEARRLVGGGSSANRSGQSSAGSSTRAKYRRKYGWDGVVGSSSYYTSGLYDEES